MRKRDKVLLASTFVLILLNWFSVKEWNRTSGLTSQSIHPVALALGLSVFAVVRLSITAYRKVRELLDEGGRIPRDARLIYFYPIIFLLPILFNRSQTTSTMLEDGTLETHTLSYGSDISWKVFICASIAFILYQLVDSLESLRSSPTGARNPAKRDTTP